MVLPIELGVEAFFGEGELGLLQPRIKLINNKLLLRIQTIPSIPILSCFPIKKSIDLIQCNNEWALLLSQQLDGLQGLLLQTVHQVNYEDGDVAEGGAAGTEVGEGLVAGGVDDEEAGEFEVEVHSVFGFFEMAFDIFFWEVGCTDLLGDTSGLTGLHVSFSQLIKNECFSSIYVTKNTDDGTSHFCFLLLISLFGESFFVFFETTLSLGLSGGIILGEDVNAIIIFFFGVLLGFFATLILV